MRAGGHLLIDGAPDCVEVAGRQVPVRTGFRCGLLFERLMLDDSLSPAARAACALRLYYPQPPEDAEAALRGVLWFWNCGVDFEAAEGNPAAGGERLFDFEADAAYIYAAFMADYRMDLAREEPHWWHFCALLRGLSPENLFCRILEWRGADLGRLTGEERAYVEKMQRRYALPLSPGEARRRAAIEAALASHGQLDGLLEG